MGTHIDANIILSNPFLLFQHSCLPRIPFMDDAPTASDGEGMQGIIGALVLRLSTPWSFFFSLSVGKGIVVIDMYSVHRLE